ncbi:MAG: relaxase MobL, partial [Pseudonocardiaceae bacterium]
SGHFSRLRRGIDAWLDEKQTVARLSSAVGYERRNVTTFIKRWAHQMMRTEALPQLLLACLPADRSLWRAGSRRIEMRKADRLVRELVLEQLEGPGSPMPAAMETIRGYADQRRETDRLSVREWRRLLDQGRNQVLERAINGVYGLLRALPPDEFRIRTPMLEVMGMDYQHLASLTQNTGAQSTGAQSTGAETATAARAPGHPETNLTTPAAAVDDGGGGITEPGAGAGLPREDDLVSFGFRLRSYSSRLEHHRDWHRTYRALAREWEKADVAGAAAADSVPLYDFYRYEADWHARCIAKYTHFLPVASDPSGFYEQQQALAEYGQRLLALRAMRGDASLQRMKDADEAERLGRQIYDQAGGRLLTQGSGGRAVLDERIRTMAGVYDDRLEELRENLADAGLVLRITRAAPRGAETSMPGGPTVQEDGSEPGEAGVSDHDGHEGDASDERGLTLEIEPGARYDFDDVKGIDLHHLGYDFTSDVEVGDTARDTFLAVTDERRRHLIAAMEYLERTRQREVIADLPVDDVAAMVRTTAELEDHAGETVHDGETVHVLRSRLAELQALPGGQAPRSAASSLDSDLAVRLQRRIEDIVRGETGTDPAAAGGAAEDVATYETD